MNSHNIEWWTRTTWQLLLLLSVDCAKCNLLSPCADKNFYWLKSCNTAWQTLTWTGKFTVMHPYVLKWGEQLRWTVVKGGTPSLDPLLLFIVDRTVLISCFLLYALQILIIFLCYTCLFFSGLEQSKRNFRQTSCSCCITR